MDTNSELKKEETESDSQEATKVENDDETQGAEASGSSWWGWTIHPC